MAERSSPGRQANRRQKIGLVWRNRKKKISQIINAYIYLPFFILIILWGKLIENGISFLKEPLPMCSLMGELTTSVANLPRQSWDLEQVGSEPFGLVRNNFFVFQNRI
jgi:hypothetical protein